LTLYRHVPHPRVEARKAAGPPKVSDGRVGTNGRIALRLTTLVGTMQAAYAFTFLALIALPAVLGFNWLPTRTLLIVGWISQTFIQLVMLAVLQLGQNLQAKASDKRSESTYLDAEAILDSARQIAEHLGAQDQHLLTQDDRLAALANRSDALADQLSALVIRLTPPSAGMSAPR
jgi:hypothetical protein